MLQGSGDMRSRLVMWLLVSVACCNGCASVADYRYLYSKKLLAWSAWRSAKDRVPDEKNTRDFAKGFKAGFLDVSRGGDGTAPAVAPKEYWTARYSCGNDCGAINLWYEGFYYGAQDALCSGYQNCHAVPSRSNCACVLVDEGSGLENNQVIGTSLDAASTDRHFNPEPRSFPNGIRGSETVPESGLGPEAGQSPGAVESNSDHSQSRENLPAESVQPADGL